MTKSTGATGAEYRPRHSRARGLIRRRLVRLAVTLLAAALLGTVGAAWLQGYRVYVVHTGSMVPTYRPGDLVIDRKASGGYRPGDVITFRHSDQTTDVVTHRVVAVTPRGLIRTKGDANATADAWQIRPDQVRGRAVARVRGLGYLVVFLRQPTGLASLVTGLLAVVMLWQLFFADASLDDADQHSGRTAPRAPRAQPAA
jgi:signal peptidase